MTSDIDETNKIIPKWDVSERFMNEVGEDLYDKWEKVVGRGSGQNSQDAKAKNIHFVYNKEENSVTITDDGMGMSKEILLNKFFGIGATTKDLYDGKTIGGFGIEAVGILSGSSYFYIKTGRWIAIYEGKFKPLIEIPAIKGTEIKIVRNKLIDNVALLRMLCSNNVKINITYNSIQVPHLPKRGKKVNESFGTVYFNRTGTSVIFGDTEINYNGYIVVRLNGLTMFFEQRSGLRGTVLIEIKSNECLTASREALKGKYKSKLNQVIDTLAMSRSNYEIKADTFEYFNSEGEDIPICRKVGYPVTIDVDNRRSQKLLQLWRKINIHILKLLKREDFDNFTYGFIFADNGASIEEHDKIIYLNPYGLRFSDKSLLLKLIKRACHEVTHLKEDYHDEDFLIIFESLLDDCYEKMKDFKQIKKEVDEQFSEEW